MELPLNDSLLDSSVSSVSSVPSLPRPRMESLMCSIHSLHPFTSKEFRGHTGYVWGCTMTSDNKVLFSGSDDTIIKIWDPSTLQCTGELHGHTDCAYFLLMTSDDALLISAGWDHKIILWDWRNRSIQHTITGHTNEVFYLFLTASDKYLVSGARDCTVRVWDFQSKAQVAEFNYGNSVFGISVTNDCKEIVATGFAETIKVFNLESKQELATYSPKIGPLQCLVLTPDNKFMVFGSRSGVLKVWTYLDKTEYCTLVGHENSLRNLSCTSDSAFVISSSLDKTIRIFSIRGKSQELKLEGCGGWIYGQFLSRDGQYLLSGSTDKILRLWKIGDRPRVSTIRGHTQAVSSVTISRNGKYIATACADKIVRKWELATGSLVAEMTGHSETLWAVAITSDMQYIASGGADKKVLLWDFESTSLVTELEGHTNTVFALVATSDNKILASSSGDMKVILWDLHKKCLYRELEGHTDTVFALTFTADNQTLVSGAGDYTIRIWEVHGTGSTKVETHTGMIESLSLNSEETMLALGCRDNTVHLWDWKSKTCFKKFPGHHTNVVKTVKFFADSNMLISASLDFSVRLWNADEERHEFLLKGHTAAVRCADVSLDGRVVVSVANDLTIRVWDIRNIGMLELADIGGPTDSFLFIAKIMLRESPEKMNYQAVFSTLKVNLAHIYCYLGYDQELSEALSLGTDIRIDDDGNSPLHYAIRRRTQGCIDIILEHITNWKHKDFEIFLNYAYAIRADFEFLLDNRSEHLPEFLEAIFFTVPNTVNFAFPKYDLPHLQYSNAKSLNPFEFIYKNAEVPENSLELPVKFKTLPFPISYMKGSNGSLELLDSIINCSNRQILRTEFVKTYIWSKWVDLWKYFLVLSVLLWTNLVLMTILLVFNAESINDTSIYLAVSLGFVIINIMLASYEIVYAFASGLLYFGNIWNLLEILRISLCLAWGIFSILQGGGYTSDIAWPMAFMNFLMGLSGFRAFDSTRHYSRFIIRGFFGSFSFLLVFFYAVIAFAVIYLAINPDSYSYLTGFWIVPSDISMDSLEGTSTNLAEYIGFMVAIMVSLIIILNSVISIYENIFESFQEEAEESDCLDIAELIMEFETFMSWNRNGKDKLYLHTCEDLVASQKTRSDRVRELQKCVTAARNESNENFKEVKKINKEILAKLDKLVPK